MHGLVVSGMFNTHARDYRSGITVDLGRRLLELPLGLPLEFSLECSSEVSLEFPFKLPLDSPLPCLPLGAGEPPSASLGVLE